MALLRCSRSPGCFHSDQLKLIEQPFSEYCQAIFDACPQKYSKKNLDMHVCVHSLELRYVDKMNKVSPLDVLEDLQAYGR